jgi:hypothetical protein
MAQASLMSPDVAIAIAEIAPLVGAEFRSEF